MLHIRQLAHRLVNDALLVVTGRARVLVLVSACSGPAALDPSGVWRILLRMLLEIKARHGRAFLRLARNDALVTTCSVWQVPLVRAARVLGVLGATLHVQGVFADELDGASLVGCLLLVVA